MKVFIKSVLTLCIISLTLYVNAVDVTFQVDMSNQTVAPEGVHIAGTFQDWDPGATLMTDAGDNIYTYTHSFVEGEDIQWKYINGDEWGEDEAVPAECNMDNNRYLVVPNADVTLDLVCFGSCGECGNPVDVTFRIDMSEETVSTNGVHIGGSFQGWNPAGSEMTDAGGGVYEITFTVTSGETLLWKYINGNSWDDQEMVPAACGVPDGYGAFNRYYTVPDENSVLDLICFSSCNPCGYVPVEVDVTFQVDMSMETVSADGVHIAGSMQDWDPTTSEMTDMGDGIYSISFTLWSNDTHQYKFINGLEWADSELVPQDCGQDDGNGAYNRFFTVPETNFTIPLVCFGSCDPCSTAILENSSLDAKFKMYPNPTEKSTNISCFLMAATNVKLIILNAMGQQINVIVDEYHKQGTFTKTIDTDLEAGIYYIVFQTDSERHTEKLIVK